MATGFDYGMNTAAGLYDGINKYIRITDIDEDSRCYIDANPVSPQGKLDDKYLVHEHDILFARTGASTGKTYLYKKSDGKLYFAGFLIRVTVNSHNNSTFVYNSTLTDKYNSWVRLTSMRSGQPGINSQEYSSYRTYYPHLDEQNRIAAFLEVLEQRIEKQRQLVEALKSYKRGALSKLFPKKGENTPEYRFRGFTEPWEQRKFSELYEKVSRKNDMSYGKEDIISVANMYYKADSNITDDSYLLTYNVFELGDIAFEGNKSKNFAHGRFVENTIGNGIVSHVFDVFKPIMPSYDLMFWKYAINDERLMGDILVRSTKASTMMTNLVANDFLQESFLVPSYEEQKKIGTFFRNLDLLITLHQRKLTEFDSVKAGLLQQLFI